MSEQPGLVSIVGAGPGDPGLLTIRAQETLTRADAIVYDAHVNRDLLPASARINGIPELYYVGKRAEQRAMAQSDVRTLLVTLARQGKRVVHLTGGDPFVFGDGSEAAQAMNDAQVPFEIIPGITAGIAATAYAGIPVTHPGIATSVIFVNGRDDPAGVNTITDWNAIAKVGGTIVVYNALKLLPTIASAMIDAGLPGEIPAAAIRAGTRATQQIVVSTLETLEHEAMLAGLTSGVTVVIGWSVLLRDELAWFDRRSLFGRRIMVAADVGGGEGKAFTKELEDLGAEITQVPPPQVARLDLSAIREDIQQISDYDWLIFPSANAVTLFWEQLLTLGRDTRALSGGKICAVGPSTAAALLDRGVTVDILPERFEASALLELLSQRSDVAGSRLLYICDEAEDDTFPNSLIALGADVIVRPAYRSVVENATAERVRRRLERGIVDLVVVTSPAAATHYLRTVGADMATRAPAAAADEATAEILRAAGAEVVAEGWESGTELRGFATTILRALNSE